MINHKNNRLEEPLWRRIFDFFARHWVLTTFISTIPVWGFTLVDIFGGNLGLEENGVFTPKAYTFLIVIFLISFFFNLLLALATNYDNEAKKSGQKLFSIVLENINSIKHAKLKRFIKYINQNKNKSKVAPFYEITQPQTQIEVVLENLQVALSQITQVGIDDISVSIVYKTDDDEDWRWLANVNIDTDMELEELKKNPNTSINQIITGKESLVFFPDKNIGVSKNNYVMGRKDAAHRHVGSILCKDISLETNEKCIQAILSISTYGLQLCESNDWDAIGKITGKVLPAFERRIQLELALYYIKEHMAKQPILSSKIGSTSRTVPSRKSKTKPAKKKNS